MFDRLFKNLPTVTKNLLIINVLFFLLTYVLGGDSGIGDSLALRFPTSPDFRIWQVITHFFMHAGWGHIFFNMFALLMFGSQLERVWGPKRFLTFYFLCAFGAAGLHTAYTAWQLNGMQTEMAHFENAPSLSGYTEFMQEHAPMDLLRENAEHSGSNSWSAQQLLGYQELQEALDKEPDNPEVKEYALNHMRMWYEQHLDTPVLGASGAIYGLLLAFGMLFPNVELMLLFFPVPVKAKYFIPGLIALEIYLGFNSFSGDNMAHFAHLGGALVGFVVVKIWQKKRNTFY